MIKSTKASDIKRSWHLLDVKGEILGRTASKIAGLLMGKSKSYFVRNMDCGDHVVVINAKDIVVTGKKETDKKYYAYSGYPGGLSVKTLSGLRKTEPEKIMLHAVKGMLPQNKLRDKMLRRLFIYPKEDHPYKDKIKN